MDGDPLYHSLIYHDSDSLELLIHESEPSIMRYLFGSGFDVIKATSFPFIFKRISNFGSAFLISDRVAIPNVFREIKSRNTRRVGVVFIVGLISGVSKFFMIKWIFLMPQTLVTGAIWSE